MSFARAGLRPTHQIAFAHDAHKLALLADDRRPADVVVQQDSGDFANARVDAHRKDIRDHHIGSFHGFLLLISGTVHGSRRPSLRYIKTCERSSSLRTWRRGRASAMDENRNGKHLCTYAAVGLNLTRKGWSSASSREQPQPPSRRTAS